MQAEQFAAAAGISAALTSRWLEPVTEAMERFSIIRPMDQAMFIAQIAHESGGFTTLTESFNYTPQALQQLFSSYFTPQQAAAMGRTSEHAAQQPQIAEQLYGKRLRNLSPVEGWIYRGRGLIQITGRENYFRCASGIGLPLLSYPDLLIKDLPAALSAAWFFVSQGCLACSGDLVKVTEIINGGSHGLADRAERLQTALTVLQPG